MAWKSVPTSTLQTPVEARDPALSPPSGKMGTGTGAPSLPIFLGTAYRPLITPFCGPYRLAGSPLSFRTSSLQAVSASTLLRITTPTCTLDYSLYNRLGATIDLQVLYIRRPRFNTGISTRTLPHDHWFASQVETHLSAPCIDMHVSDLDLLVNRSLRDGWTIPSPMVGRPLFYDPCRGHKSSPSLSPQPAPHYYKPIIRGSQSCP